MSQELLERMLAGDQFALARLISLVERRSEPVREMLGQIYPRLGRAHTIGVTGPPGAGKSTLVDRLTQAMRQQSATVGIVAVDPTSPFTGGAVLGDRVRMQQHYLDEGVFIRSMATRGAAGGLARATKDTMKLLDAFGQDYIIVETVGVGQTELNVMEAVDTTVVVLVPESGDAIQMMKAGLLEIGDLFVVNKADRSGAEPIATELRLMIKLGHRKGEWEPPVLLSQAIQGIGTDEVFQAIQRHRQTLEASGRWGERRRQYRTLELVELIEEQLKERLLAEQRDNGPIGAYFRKVADGELDPYSAAQAILSDPMLVGRLLGQTGEP